MVQGSQVSLRHVIHDMEARTLRMELRQRAIKRCVPCGDMERRLKIPHPAKVKCGFQTTPEECLYDSGLIRNSETQKFIQHNTRVKDVQQCYCIKIMKYFNYVIFMYYVMEIEQRLFNR